VTHALAGSAQDPGRVVEVGAAGKRERDVPREDGDLADAVRDHSFRGSVQQDDLRAHLEYVLVARRYLLVNQLAKAQGERSHAGFVAVQVLEQLARGLRHRSPGEKRRPGGRSRGARA
jgi:hypothetical protein